MNALLLVLALSGALPQGGDSVRVGERILLRVDGEPTLTDTFAVLPGPRMMLPGIGDVPLAGVTHAGLSAYLQTYLGKYLRAPKVDATSLMRVAVLGEVTKPGYYAVTSQTTLADVMMLAGGPTHEAKMSDARVRRGEQELVQGDAFAQAVAKGTTVSGAGLESGDQIFVPAVERRDPESKFRIISILVTIPVAIYGLVKLF